MLEKLQQHIEALIFTSETSISTEEIRNCLISVYEFDIPIDQIEFEIENIKEKYRSDIYAFELLDISGGVQFLTKKEFHQTIGTLLQQKARKRLSVAAMETLAIIAYKQPVTKAEVEHIRGVNSDYSVQKLLEKELIEISGKSDGPGRPVLYSTSKSFMDFFGIKSVKDLPQLKDIQSTESNEIGEVVSE